LVLGDFYENLSRHSKFRTYVLGTVHDDVSYATLLLATLTL